MARWRGRIARGHALNRERISLGLKQTQPDPWIKLVEAYPVGTIVDGTVTKLVPFGVFVQLGDATEGLVHISEMAPRHIEAPAQVVKVGDVVKVKVMEVNPERRRISLSMKAAAAELGIEIAVDEDYVVEERPARKARRTEGDREAAAPAAEEPAAEEAPAEAEAEAEVEAAPAAEEAPAEEAAPTEE